VFASDVGIFPLLKVPFYKRLLTQPRQSSGYTVGYPKSTGFDPDRCHNFENTNNDLTKKN
jgi:hypothetical protein